MSAVHEALNEFSEDSLTFKLLKGVYAAVPYSPENFHLWRSVDDAVRALDPNASDDLIQKARQIADSNEQVANVLWMARVLDTGDKGYAIATGLHTAWKLFQGKDINDALETDGQQRNDAILKAVGMAYMVYNAFPGSLQERAEAFRDSPTGQAMMIYYASIEVALPFADNAAMAGSGAISQLLTTQGAAQAENLKAAGRDVEGSVQMLVQMANQIQRVADHARNYVQPVAAQVAQYVPEGMNLGGGMDVADKAAGALANAADVMDVYRLLGGHLAAESAAYRAIKGIA